MIGNSAKPILDVFIIDSTQKNNFKFDEHTVILYADKYLLSVLYSSFKSEKKFDSTSSKSKPDYRFGTFLFYCQLQNENTVKVRANALQSTCLFQKMLCNLSSDNEKQSAIVKEIDYILFRIGAKL